MRLKSAPGAEASLWSFILVALTFLVVIAEAKDKVKPDMSVAKFEETPLNFAFFRGSDVVMFQENGFRSVWRSSDGGATWEKPEDIEDGQAFLLIMHPYDDDRAYVLSREDYHWKTEDKGKSWSKFYTGIITNPRAEWMSFHADDPNKIIFNGLQSSDGFMYHEAATYTNDNFEHDALPLISPTGGCWWARSSELFTTSEKDTDANRILCIITEGGILADPANNRVIISDSYFAVDKAEGTIDAFEPDMDNGETTRGAVNLLVVKSFILVAAVSRNTNEMAVYVTDDTKTWHRAVFPAEHRLDSNMYTVLESTNYSIQVDVRADGRVDMGTLFTSNSNGTYFTKTSEHTNRDELDHVDFERVSGVQGVFIINQVDNYDEAGKGSEKVRKSKITFDDGRNFEPIKMKGDDGDEVHLHSVTEYRNVGTVFSSPAPGLIMGNGNKGDYLKSYGESRLFISDDAGLTWTKGPKGPHKYEFGDQGSILIAIEDSENVGAFKYSLNHGEDWTDVELPDHLEISPMLLTTAQDSTSLNFILTGVLREDDVSQYYVISIDFAGLQERTCTKDDMEPWAARADENGDPTCIMGHTQVYSRRQKGADCFIKEYDPPAPKLDSCDCKDEDYECDFNFVRVDDECELAPTASLVPPEGSCEGDDPDETFEGPSGWRRIPGNRCESSGKDREAEKKKWSCSEAKRPSSSPSSGNVTHTSFQFDGEANTIELHYLERSERNGDDDTVIARAGIESSDGRTVRYSDDVYITRDQGKNWERIEAFGDDDILYITTHPNIKDMVFFATSSKKVWYTTNRGSSFDYFTPPDEIDRTLTTLPVVLNPTQKNSVIWLGKKDGKTYAEASLSTDRGDNWKTIRRHVSKCEFTSSPSINFRNQTQVVCVARMDEDESNPWQLIYNDDPGSGKEEFHTAIDDVDSFAQMAEFIVVSKKNISDDHSDDKRSSDNPPRTALVSLNGRDYAETKFPINYDIHGYTVLDSATHAVNLFAKIEDGIGRSYGSILKSNSNGTSYVQSVANVNCNDNSFVDFEKMAGLEGVVLVNTVLNAGVDEPKKLQSRISHNDGAGWAFLTPPAKTVDGGKFECSGKGNEKCALHLHGLSERKGASNAYSSESAIGLMCGIGNVGSHLSSSEDADTFMTTDGGLSWKMVMKGSHRWSFGDHGAIVVLAPRNSKTNKVYYSLDAGDTWDEALFSDDEMDIIDVTTLRSGASRSFIVWGHDGDKVFSHNLDFSGLTNRQCELLPDDPDKSDYEIFSPGHPLADNGCLFGHKKLFLRKKKDRTDCYNGKELLPLPSQNCECTKQDFECDYNFEMDVDGSCKLVEGLKPISIDEWCSANPDEVSFYKPSGMRRIPLTTCVGGKEFDKVNEEVPCPGKEEQFEKEHRSSGVGIFFAVVISLGIAAGAGWWMWNHYHNNFGQIRLGEQSGLDNDSPWIRYPVIVVSAAVAVAGALPLLASSLWRTIRSQVGGGAGGGGGGGRGGSWLRGGNQRRFTTRDSFARGRGDYSIVDEDEGALLGDDSDDDM